MSRTLIRLMACASIAGCSPPAEQAADNSAAGNVGTSIEWPATLKPIGDGYPVNGAPCRRLGESAAVADYLDDSADLIGCPDAKSATALDGKIVGTEGTITLVSVPGSGLPPGEPEYGMGDARNAQGFHATAFVPCGIEGTIDASCSAGVKRNTEPDGTSYVEVTKPDGSKRVLFFQGINASGADSAEADGSSTYRFKWRREDDWTVIEYGPERYRIPDALVVGG